MTTILIFAGKVFVILWIVGIIWLIHEFITAPEGEEIPGVGLVIRK